MNKQSLIEKDYWLAGWLIGVICVAAVSVLPSTSPPEAFDKELHLIIYCLLTAIPLARIRRRQKAILFSVLMPIMGFLLEYIQRNLSGREFSPEDMIANNLGALAGIVIGTLFRLNRRLKRNTRR